jgi:hypothetical protein
MAEVEETGVVAMEAMAMAYKHGHRGGKADAIFVRLMLVTLAMWLVPGPFAMSSDVGPLVKPVPAGLLELASGPVQTIDAPADRKAVLADIGRGRQSFALRAAGRAYDIKIRFQVNSNGATNYDGAWTMEEIFSPDYGLRWTAKAESGYSITRISSGKAVYQEGSDAMIPLRLQEVRGILFDPLQSPAYANRGTIRKIASRFRGAPVSCVLLSSSMGRSRPANGRDWDETEECFDPQTGLLQVHSEVPGRYVVYDYSNAPRLADRILPRKVTVSEGAQVISQISVDSAELSASPDPGLFTPTEAMKANGPAPGLTTATKIVRVAGIGPIGSSVMLNPVCVFGVLNPAGRLVEAHSLAPLDPNSQAAVSDAQQIDFSPTIAGAAPQQHFVFVVEEFPSAQ